MKTIQYEKKLNDISPNSIPYLPEDAILCDIETTGFSSKTTNIYMIGVASRRDCHICITQFFSENNLDEELLLVTFFNYIKSYQTIMTFNGDGFDLPYLKEKAKKYHLSTQQLDQMISFDLYKYAKKYKHILKCSSLKQKGIEEFLGIKRKDLFSGGELISMYYDYVKTGNLELEEAILLHNFEDMLGMIYILPILSYEKAFQGNFSFHHSKLDSIIDYYGKEISCVIFSMKLEYQVPKPISFSYNTFYLTISKNTLSLTAQIDNQRIRVPYLNYKDYYYLIQEDMAVLKELAKYVQPDNKKKATKENCYGKFLINEENIKNGELMSNYVKNVLNYFITCTK